VDERSERTWGETKQQRHWEKGSGFKNAKLQIYTLEAMDRVVTRGPWTGTERRGGGGTGKKKKTCERRTFLKKKRGASGWESHAVQI